MLVAAAVAPRAPVALLGMLGATAAARAARPVRPRSAPRRRDPRRACRCPASRTSALADADRDAGRRHSASPSSATPTTSSPAAPSPSRHGETIDPQRELLALGAANLGAGLLQGFPVSSSGSRTAIVDAVGGRTQLAGLVTVACTLLALLHPAARCSRHSRSPGLAAVTSTPPLGSSTYRSWSRFRQIPAQRARAGHRHHRRGAHASACCSWHRGRRGPVRS